VLDLLDITLNVSLVTRNLLVDSVGLETFPVRLFKSLVVTPIGTLVTLLTIILAILPPLFYLDTVAMGKARVRNSMRTCDLKHYGPHPTLRYALG
jgi:hypothetical protein